MPGFCEANFRRRIAAQTESMPTPRQAIQRQWELIQALHKRRRGLTATQLLAEISASRATLYRDLGVLRAAGVPIHTETVNGETRFSIVGDPLPDRVPPLQLFALRVACSALRPLGGTRLVRELERLRDRLPTPRQGELDLDLGLASPHDASVVGMIERGLVEHRSVYVDYRGTHDGGVRQRRLAPLSLRLVKGQLYVGAVDLDKHASRTFKAARLESARLGEKFDPTGMSAPDFSHAAVAWSGERTVVRVKLAASVARFATEWPLVAHQEIERAADGRVVVRAEVSGIEEALRWVLSWGRNAEVLAPDVLRVRVEEELRGALARYGEPRGRLPRAREHKVSHAAETVAGEGDRASGGE